VVDEAGLVVEEEVIVEDEEVSQEEVIVEGEAASQEEADEVSYISRKAQLNWLALFVSLIFSEKFEEQE
jgi:hypothetical protein